MLNFNWWVNRKDPPGRNVFAGGFLGLDNIGVFDRSAQLPTGGIARAGRRHGVDGVLLPEHARDRADPVPRTTRSTRRSPSSSSSTSSWIAYAMDRIGDNHDEMWDEEDGFFYDCCACPTARRCA